ncbi:MAG TPA: hypothetical protein VGK59_23350 [Ohtaekwangia sp.]
MVSGMTHQTLETKLQDLKPFIGHDYHRYRNHVYRVFLNCLLLDTEESNIEKYAITAVYHDIGIWTDHTFDYLDPSIAQARKYLNEIERPEWVEEISLMIYWHHKVSRYKGKHEKVIETFRRADWIDVSLGLMTFRADLKSIQKNKREFPNLGFHGFLIKATMKNLLKHPLNPLPMFKS